jgi:pimeloyl-ACP methyl ester carboxylesterase/DNA-binding CsgD family transcriptional regulator
MGTPSQHVQFCRTADGVRIAYAVVGRGAPLVRAPHWCTHLEYDWQTPIWSHLLEELCRDHALVRFDQRGGGISDWDAPDISFDGWLRDMEAVVDAAKLDRFAIFGMSQGAAIGIEYAARHPERVSKLLLLGGYARGKLKRDPTPRDLEDVETQLKIVRLGWERRDPSYRLLFSSQYIPEASIEQLRAAAELMRISASGENAAQMMLGNFNIDVSGSVSRVRCPTLVLHGTGDVRCPFEQGRYLAGSIPGARLVPLETKNHVLLWDEPAFERFVSEKRAFLAPDRPGKRLSLAELSEREVEVLEQLARGLDNAQIAARLGMAEKTVRNYVSRIFDKIEVESRAQAIVRAREAGLGLQG